MCIYALLYSIETFEQGYDYDDRTTTIIIAIQKETKCSVK